MVRCLSRISSNSQRMLTSARKQSNQSLSGSRLAAAPRVAYLAKTPVEASSTAALSVVTTRMVFLALYRWKRSISRQLIRSRSSKASTSASGSVACATEKEPCSGLMAASSSAHGQMTRLTDLASCTTPTVTSTRDSGRTTVPKARAHTHTSQEPDTTGTGTTTSSMAVVRRRGKTARPIRETTSWAVSTARARWSSPTVLSMKACSK